MADRLLTVAQVAELPRHQEDSRTLPPPADRRAADRVRQGRPPRPHPRIRRARLHRREHRPPLGQPVQSAEGCLMANTKGPSPFRLDPAARVGPLAGPLSGPDGLMRPCSGDLRDQEGRGGLAVQMEADLTRGLARPGRGERSTSWSTRKRGSRGLARPRRSCIGVCCGCTCSLLRQLDSGDHAAPGADVACEAGRPGKPTTAAKAYRLLKSILATATDDELIRRNPCRIRGAGGGVARSGPSPPWPRSMSSRSGRAALAADGARRVHRCARKSWPNYDARTWTS